MKAYITLSFTVVLALVTTFAHGDEFRINGATTVLDRVVAPHQAAVEAATGHKIKAIGLSTGRGVMDLLTGKCDAAMASEPLDMVVETAKAAGKDVDINSLHFSVMMMDEIVFVTHTSNPVKSLTFTQIKDIHTGKIKNWKEVGGNDLPIEVYADIATGATRAIIKKIVLKGEEFGEDVSTEYSVKKAANRVSKSEGGIAGVSRGFADDYPLNILKTTKIERPLGFITMGAPSGKMEQIILAFKESSTAKAAK